MRKKLMELQQESYFVFTDSKKIPRRYLGKVESDGYGTLYLWKTAGRTDGAFTNECTRPVIEYGERLPLELHEKWWGLIF